MYHMLGVCLQVLAGVLWVLAGLKITPDVVYTGKT
jgi:hypothetical protein